MGSNSPNTPRYERSVNPNQTGDLRTPSHGILPVLDGQRAPKKDSRSNAATGASAAGVRAFTAQAVAFYFRAPVKAFFRTRVDYLVYARSVNQDVTQAAIKSIATGRRIPWTQLWRNSTPGLLAHAVKTQGWKIIPEQVLPPLVANVAVGAILYTSYLQILGRLHEPSSEVRRRVYPPPCFTDTFTAGFLAGGIQSLVAAPLDALMVRYERMVALHGNGNGNGNGKVHAALDKTMVAYGREKLREIGARGIFAGWTLSFAKDSIGSGVFFGVFEWTKAQGYYKFVRWYYGSLREEIVDLLAAKRPEGYTSVIDQGKRRTVIRPHYALEPAFLLFAGMAATVAQQGVLFPLTNIQQRHFERLEDLDAQARRILNTESAKRRRGTMLRAYVNAYSETINECAAEASKVGGMRRWLYRGFWWSTIRQVPSTSAGLIIFELIRRKYGLDSEEVRISQDGYDIVLK